MHIADITMFWTPSSGGVRTFLEAKDAWLAKQPEIRHTLLVPGAIAACAGARVTLPAPSIPFGDGYRFPLRRQAWVEHLVGLAPDIIEAGDPYVLAWAALQACRRLQVPAVGFYHSDLPRLVGTRAGQWTNRWLNAYIARLYRHFDRVLAPSHVMANKLRSLGVERVFVQPLGVDPVQFNPCHRDPAVRSELGLDDATRLLIFAGRGSHEKNLPVLLQAITLLGKGFHLHLVGSCLPVRLPDFHLHLVGSCLPVRLPDNVSKTDCFVGRQQLARWLASSDALVHAGDRETFGLIVLEAMASGIPVVGVQAGAVAELVVPGTGLLAKSLSAESLAWSVRALFADGWREIGRRARRQVEQHYAWERVLPQLIGHYQELTGQGLAIPEARFG